MYVQCTYSVKRPVYILAFGVYNSKQVNVTGIQIFRAQFLALHLRKVMLNAAKIFLFRIIHTKGKYIYRSFSARTLYIFILVLYRSL